MSSIVIRVSVPEVDVNKTVKVLREDTVWGIKLSLINKLSKVLANAHNFGLYLPGTSDRDGGFLQDHMLMVEYQLPNNSNLIFKHKGREVFGIPEKQLQKWNNKKVQKEFIEWIRKKSYNKIKDALERGFDPNYLTETGDTPLAVAAACDQPETILLLVQTGGAFTDYRCADWKTPVHRAVIAGHVRALSCLLSLGASPNLLDKENMTPLYIASLHGKPGCAEALLNAGAVFDQVDDNGRTELHQACLKDSPAVAQLLIDFGADVNRKNHAGNTPLHVAASAGSAGSVRALLLAGAERSIQNSAGDTAHSVAILTEHWDVADLIGNFKDPVSRNHRHPEGIMPIVRTSGMAPLLKVREYVPPPPPPGYRGVCPPPADAPMRVVAV